MTCDCPFCVWRGRFKLARDVVFWAGQAALLSGAVMLAWGQTRLLGLVSVGLGAAFLFGWIWMGGFQRRAELEHLLKRLISGGEDELRLFASWLRESAAADARQSDE